LKSEDRAKRSKPNVVLWLDLLGFAKQYITEKEKALLRISVFHDLSVKELSNEVHVVQLNDATVISMDLEEDNDSQLLTNFLYKCDTLFETSTYADRLLGGYGTRRVISVGERLGLRGNFGGTNDNSGKLTADKIRFSSPPSIMMNMAFAQSYLLESSGKLLKEPSLYIQENLLSDYKINWVSPHWEDHGAIDFNENKFIIMRTDTE
jgi:hypothetical protein